ncbi:MAG: hypothetical protein ACC645_03765 [Pirellulales bacterium]
MLIDPFRLNVAFVPLAAYCLLLGLINLRRRPLLTTGARDLASLSLAVAGLVAVGPLDLFMPATAANRFGPYVWLLLLAVYALIVTFLILSARPRLVLYNISTDTLRPILAEVAVGLDRGARWAGDSLFLPALGIQLHLEGFTAMRNVSVIASEPRQDPGKWRRLEIALASAIRPICVAPNPRGAALVALGLGVMAICLVLIVADPQGVIDGWQAMMGR